MLVLMACNVIQKEYTLCTIFEAAMIGYFQSDTAIYWENELKRKCTKTLSMSCVLNKHYRKYKSWIVFPLNGLVNMIDIEVPRS